MFYVGLDIHSKHVSITLMLRRRQGPVSSRRYEPRQAVSPHGDPPRGDPFHYAPRRNRVYFGIISDQGEIRYSMQPCEPDDDNSADVQLDERLRDRWPPEKR
jgi:hypothetical protein